MAQLKPRLTVRAIRPLISGLRELGRNPSAILAAIGVDDTTLNDPDGRVPTSVAMAFLAHAVEQTGDTNLGLHLAQRAELSSFDVHFYAMASRDEPEAVELTAEELEEVIAPITFVEHWSVSHLYIFPTLI